MRVSLQERGAGRHLTDCMLFGIKRLIDRIDYMVRVGGRGRDLQMQVVKYSEGSRADPTDARAALCGEVGEGKGKVWIEAGRGRERRLDL